MKTAEINWYEKSIGLGFGDGANEAFTVKLYL
jgi:hypothetical protein